MPTAHFTLDSHDATQEVMNESVQRASEEKEFDVHEKILARDRDQLYEAKVLSCREDDEQPGAWKYRVHFIGYKKVRLRLRN